MKLAVYVLIGNKKSGLNLIQYSGRYLANISFIEIALKNGLVRKNLKVLVHFASELFFYEL